MRKLAQSPLPLLAVLLLALALRVWGLTWGLPSATHYFSYHPDESRVLEIAGITMNPLAGHLLPHFYNYGSLQLYLVSFANTLAALFGIVDIAPKNFAVWYPQWAKMYLIGRLLTVGMGVGTIWTVYAIGLRLWGRRAGLLAALTLAIIPLHAQHSHFLTVDVPATFWGTLSLLWAIRLATNDPKPLRAALLAGLFAGLATATKYNMALTVLPLVVACVIRGPEEPTRLVPRYPPETEGKGGLGQRASFSLRFGGSTRSEERTQGEGGSSGWVLCLGAGLLAFILAFFAACPGALLENKTFLEGLRFESIHVQNADDPTFRDTGNGFVYHIARNLDAGLGLPLLLLTLVSVGYALYRRERGDGLLAAFALPYYVLISLAAVRYARYTIPLLPILALWVGRMLADGSRLSRPAWLRICTVLISAVLLATLVNASSLISVMAGEDTRDEGLLWLKSYRSSTVPVGFPTMPWFGTVPVNPYFPYYQRGGWRRLTPPAQAGRVVYAGQDWDVGLLKSANPDCVVLSEYDYNDALRLRTPEAVAYLAVLKQGYRPVAGFSPLFSTLDGSVERGGLLSRDMPHDMTYPSPIIIIFSRTTKGMQRSE